MLVVVESVQPDSPTGVLPLTHTQISRENEIMIFFLFLKFFGGRMVGRVELAYHYWSFLDCTVVIQIRT